MTRTIISSIAVIGFGFVSTQAALARGPRHRSAIR